MNDETQAPEEEAEDTKPVLPEVLVLPSGARVWFRDIEELSGRDFKDMRQAYNLSDLSRGEGRRLYETAAMVLITRWDIPYRPGLPLPGSPEGGEGSITDLLQWRDCRALDVALGKAVLHMRMGVTDGDPLPDVAG